MIQREAWYVEADEDEVLFYNEWMTVKETPGGWVYLDTPPCVAVLPFKVGDNLESVEFLIRHENIPSMPGEGLKSWVIFGGQQEHGSPEAAAVAELYEEGGIKVSEDELIDLGEVWTRKDVNKPCRIFAVNVSEKEQSEPGGDGSEGEKDFKLEWVDWNGLVDHGACVLHSMAIRLYTRLFQP